MKSLRLAFALCAAAAATMLGCGLFVDEDRNESSETSCAIVSVGQPWWNQGFSDQTSMFHVEFNAAVASTTPDIVIGLSDGAASNGANLAAIVRFNPQGTLDARNAGEYRADLAVPYQANERYGFRLDVDVKAHTYSVWLKSTEAAPYIALARDYTFGSSVTKLTNIAVYVDPETSAGGALELCGFQLVKDNTTADGCMASVAGGGFANAATTPSSTVVMARFTARASHANMDGVVGVASGDVDGYDDFAASIRFWTNGRVEVRDGNTFHADREVTYVAGQLFDVRMLMDLASHTYSVYVWTNDIDANSRGHVLLASGYQFRPTQANVASLDRIATAIASETGRIDACELASGPRAQVVALRDGNFDVVPLADTTTLLSNPGSTLRLNGNNIPIAAVATGGEIAVDGAGIVYTASIAGGALRVSSFNAFFVPRFTVHFPVAASSRVLDVKTTMFGTVAIAIGGSNPYDRLPHFVLQFGRDGRYIRSDAVPAGTTAIGLAESQYAVARQTTSGVRFETRSYVNASLIRSVELSGPFSIDRLLLAPDVSLVAGGHLHGMVNFGDGQIAPYVGPSDSGVYWDAFIVALSPGLTLRFSRRLTSQVEDIQTNGRDIAVSFLTWTQLHYANFVVFNSAGTPVFGSGTDSFVGPFGFPGKIAIADPGRVYFNVNASLAGPNDNHFPFLVTLDPPSR